MNALATIEAHAPPAGFSDWLTTGKALLTERTRIEWQLADWIADGREQFGNQAEFDFLADELGIAPKALKTAAKVAAAFPPHMRDSALTFEHHEAVVGLPATDALAVLKQARDGHLDDRETRVEAVKRRTELGQGSVFADDDWEHHELMAIQRAWNRARTSVRAEFLELAAEVELGIIDA
ncbi:hypothetical protein GCM10011380_00450 [Sphingomonas metalli]|uniref:DUF222 domain-containing protein n=1 Tax=Sphingomonas metalli TaxID=1779358 RepID=A0A916SUS7_9SPHN|nr:hypothetical protein [Sphingomonas metalli]GGB14954.1 hypothetical protein GCM10011380_00450 [Sphingomonas metalli]